jgi:flavoprotein
MVMQRYVVTAHTSGAIHYNVQILQNVVKQGKKLGKTVYVFSVDAEGGKVAHANYVAESAQSSLNEKRKCVAKHFAPGSTVQHVAGPVCIKKMNSLCCPAAIRNL